MLLDRFLPSPLPGEKIIFYLRRHWFVFARQVVWYVILLTLPPVAVVLILKFMPSLWDRLFNGALTQVLVTLAVSLYYLAIWLFFWNAWVDYYLDVWLVTNERIVSLEQRGLFNRTVAELRLSRVQDVAAQTKGLASTIFNFGQIRVQTAGEEANFVFHQVPHPYEVAEKVMRLADGWKHSHPHITTSAQDEIHRVQSGIP
ncbi:MAG: PH domain-containing protein [Candidatus Kerfeldbacteria bacterium]|nr:PH domain-containing protein [Candidatus Kerfeldbacteria bacterium]